MSHVIEWEVISKKANPENGNKPYFSLSDLEKIKSIDCLYTKALALVGRTYGEKTDLSQMKAINHCNRVSDCFATEVEQIVGLLHDFVEDGFASLNDLRNLGFPEPIVEAILLLTRDKKVFPNYDDYITHLILSGNVLAMRVKLADMLDNSSILRTEKLSAERQRKILLKYHDNICRIQFALIDLKADYKLLKLKKGA